MNLNGMAIIKVKWSPKQTETASLSTDIWDDIMSKRLSEKGQRIMFFINKLTDEELNQLFHDICSTHNCGPVGSKHHRGKGNEQKTECPFRIDLVWGQDCGVD